MLNKIFTVARGAVHDSGQRFLDEHAFRLLEQELRDAAAALDRCRRELAAAMARERALERQAAHLDSLIAHDEASALAAVDAGNRDLALEVAARIGDRRERRACVTADAADHANRTARMRAAMREAEQRVSEVRRGLETARSEASLLRAEALTRRTGAAVDNKITCAEQTLARLRSVQQRLADEQASLLTLEREDTDQLDARLEAAGCLRPARPTAEEILAEVCARRAGPD